MRGRSNLQNKYHLSNEAQPMQIFIKKINFVIFSNRLYSCVGWCIIANYKPFFLSN